MKLLLCCVYIFLITADGLDASRRIASSWSHGGVGRWRKADARRFKPPVNVRNHLPSTTTSTTPRTTTPPPATEVVTTSLSHHRNSALLPLDSCGLQSGRRTVNFDDTVMNHFPWLVNLLYDGDFKCGGTLINSRYVLTAAHCIPRFTGDYLTKLVGVTLGGDPDCEDGVCLSAKNVAIEEIIPHPYFRRNRAYNVALIRLSESVEFKDNIIPICMPMDEQVANYVVDESFLVSRWGNLETGTLSGTKQVVGLTYVEERKCKLAYIKTMDPKLHVCAGRGDGKDSCDGVRGGPLMAVRQISGTLRYILAGVLSRGPFICGTAGIPELYVKPFPNMLWIMDTIKP